MTEEEKMKFWGELVEPIVALLGGLTVRGEFKLVEATQDIIAKAEQAYEAGRKDERERILDMCKEGLWDGGGIKFHLDKQGENNEQTQNINHP